MDDRSSKLVLFSLGIVLETKSRTSDVIRVYPVEELPFVDGNLSTFSKQYSNTGINAKGVEQKTNLSADVSINAKWFPDGHDNRITSPDVVSGETVKIYRFGDTDEYYWTTLFREPKLRRKETVCYGFSNIEGGLSEFDKDSSYWFEVSTHDKKIQLHTSNNDGEPFTYDFTLDTDTGSLIITDSIGNTITLNSDAHVINLKNSDGAEFDMNKGDVTLNVPGTYTVNAGHYVNNSPTDHNRTVNLNQGYNAKGDNGSGKTGSLQGDFNLDGSFNTTGTVSASGDITSGSNITASGEVHGSNI